MCVPWKSVSYILGLRIAAGHALGPRAGPFASHGQAFLETLGCEVVNHRVQAAVKGGQAQSDGVQRSGEAFHTTTSQGLCTHQSIKEEDRVIRHKADDEYTQMDQNHPQDAFLAVAAMSNGNRALQSPQDK